jgi:uncharacterized protein YggE
MRQRSLAVGLAVVALLAVGTAGAVLTLDSTAAASPSQAADGDRTITVGADGSASADPDTAIVSVAVVADGSDPATIRADLATGASDLRAALTDAGVAADRITTTQYAIREPPRREPGERPGAPYRGVHAFEVELADTEAVGRIVDAAANAGAEVQGVRYTLSDDSQADLRNDALRAAMDSAATQADTIAQAGGLSVTGLASVDATPPEFSPVRYESDAALATSAGGTDIETGDVTVSASVEATYNATG